jgi:hypothetical protein
MPRRTASSRRTCSRDRRLPVDLEQTRFLDFAGLARYCHLVAGVVGEVAANIFGRTSDATVEYAHRLGLACNSRTSSATSGDDARRGRIYLPVSELQQFDVKAQEILARTAPYGYSDRFTALMKFQAARAHRCYDEGWPLLPDSDREAQKPGLMMANIYRTLCASSRRTASRCCTQRTSLTPLRKLWIAMRTNWRGAEAPPCRRRRRRRRVGRAGGGDRSHVCRPCGDIVRDGRALGRSRAPCRHRRAALDNGQHILIGALPADASHAALVGVDPDLRFVRTPLRLTDADGRACSCRRARRASRSCAACSPSRLDAGRALRCCARRGWVCAAFAATAHHGGAS